MDHSSSKLEISNSTMSRGENPKCLDINTLLDNLWVKEEIIREIRSHFKLNVKVQQIRMWMYRQHGLEGRKIK